MASGSAGTPPVFIIESLAYLDEFTADVPRNMNEKGQFPMRVL